MNIELDDFSDGYYFSIWNADEIERYNGMTNYWNDIFSGLDATFGSVMNWNDAFNTNYGSGGGGRTGEEGGNCEMWMQSPVNKKWANLSADEKNEVLKEPNALLREKTDKCEDNNEFGYTICEVEVDGINYIIATNFHEGGASSIEPDFNVSSKYSIVGTAHTHGKGSNSDHSSGDLLFIYQCVNSEVIQYKNININNFTSVRVGTGEKPQNHILQIKDEKNFKKWVKVIIISIF